MHTVQTSLLFNSSRGGVLFCVRIDRVSRYVSSSQLMAESILCIDQHTMILYTNRQAPGEVYMSVVSESTIVEFSNRSTGECGPAVAFCFPHHNLMACGPSEKLPGNEIKLHLIQCKYIVIS